MIPYAQAPGLGKALRGVTTTGSQYYRPRPQQSTPARRICPPGCCDRKPAVLPTRQREEQR